ncbi:acyltransferase domain-containing protein [Streptomyces sp. NRRL S-495]|uniref:acyl-CoA dehydrogenase family protein n=1 Tax=Streptomyces sp. NRRL S-495 TaxID=1609133 RepID=UPI000698EB96|nr:acyltransferase domain-containing protein [Streptomyces sp. NRRL S-495]
MSGPHSPTITADVVHLFPGQGDFGLTALLRTLPRTGSLAHAVAEVFEEADVVAPEFDLPPIGPRLAGSAPLSVGALAADPPGTVQLALFGVSLAVHRALEADGCRAQRLLAVSFGEIPALTAAGCCSTADGARLACRLGQLLTGHGGGMTLLGAGPSAAARLLAEAGPGARTVVVACVNHSGETVVSGPLDGLAVVEHSAEARGIPARRLRLPFMSHHPALAREAGVFADFARRLRLAPPRRPVYSVVSGRFHRADSDLPGALSACLIRPFDLPAVLGAALLDASLVVEAGTGSTLTNSVRRIDPRQEALAPIADGRWPTGSPAPLPSPCSGPSPTAAEEDAPRPRPDLDGGAEAPLGTGGPAEDRARAIDVLTRLSGLLPPRRAGEFGQLLAEHRAGQEALRTDLRTDTSAHRRLMRLAASLPPAAEVVADPDLLAALSEATALADPSLYQTFLSHYVLCVGSLVLLGGEAADRGGALAHARTKGSFMVTEFGEAGSHLEIRTEARFDPVHRVFTLHTPDQRAAKFSSVAAFGLPQQAVVCARLLTGSQDGGVFSFLVDITGADGRPAPGVSVSDPIPVDALPLPYGLVRFHGVRVPYDRWLPDGAVIDPAGVLHDPRSSPDARLRRTLGCGQGLWATLPSAMAALSGRSAAMAWRFNAGRRSHGRLAPGRPLLEYRTQQHAVLGALAAAYSLRRTARAALSTWADLRAARSADGPDTAMTFSPWASVDRSLALYKAHSTRTAAEVIDDLQHRCGVSGLFDHNRLPGYLGFARAFDSAGGDNTLILLDAGRALAEEAEERARSGPPPTDPDALPTDPTDPAWWPAVVTALRDRLAADLAAASSARAGAGHRDLELWNPLLEDALELGDVQARRLAAEAAAGGDGTDGRGWPVPRAADLAALDGLAGPLLATGVLAPATVRALPAAMDAVCDRLHRALPDIVAALDPGAGIARTPLDEPDRTTALLTRALLAPHGAATDADDRSWSRS